MATSAASARETFLSRIISTVASSLDLEEVLTGVVRLLSDASAVHACFVYLLDRDGSRLVLRAASDPYGDLAGEIALDRGEGLAWWSLEHREPAYIRERALEDPRVKYVPELEEELFQSLVAVPVFGRGGEPIGAITLHTEAPREFTRGEVDFLVSSASLVAGAIENARLYDDASGRVRELEHLTALGEEIAKAETADELLPTVAARARELLRADACHVYVLEPSAEELRLRGSAPLGSAVRPTLVLSELGPEVSRRARTLSIPLVVNGELLGLLRASGTAERDLAYAVANQAAVAMKKIELIERLTERNLIKDFFEELAAGGALGDLRSRAARVGFDLDAPALVLVAAPPDERLERALAAAAPGSVFDTRDDALRALLRVPPAGERAVVEAARRAQEGGATAVGISNVCCGAASFAAGFEEARHALVGATVLATLPAVVAYDALGPYKYLLRMSRDAGERDAHREAVARIADYDAQRGGGLLPTLEELLRRRGNISATADALSIHPNTLRQRLRRIQELTGLDLRREDWLLVEIAVKLVTLQRALEQTHTTSAPRV